jgi:hypothetical protein
VFLRVFPAYPEIIEHSISANTTGIRSLPLGSELAESASAGQE